MKRATKIKMGILIAGQFLATGSASASIMLSFKPPTETVDVGGFAFLGLYADATPDDAFVSFGLDLLYDPAMAALVDATLNTSIFTGLQPAPDLGNGSIGLMGFVPFSDAPLTGPVQLASLKFQLLVAGTSAVEVSISGPSQGFGLRFPPGYVIHPGQIETAHLVGVPEPSSLALGMIGLAGLALILFRNRNPDSGAVSA